LMTSARGCRRNCETWSSSSGRRTSSRGSSRSRDLDLAQPSRARGGDDVSMQGRSVLFRIELHDLHVFVSKITVLCLSKSLFILPEIFLHSSFSSRLQCFPPPSKTQSRVTYIHRTIVINA
jgi:hypothetical protein